MTDMALNINQHHPAISSFTNFDELEESLAQAAHKGLVRRFVYPELPHLVGYTYCQEEIRKADIKIWSPELLSARGIILDMWQRKIAALPFPKFFNMGEMPNDVPHDEGFVAYQKYDGSLGICFWDDVNNIWRINTKGSFVSDQAVWATNWINQPSRKFIEKHLDKDCTYLFEIVYQSNRIVIDYNGWEGLVLLSAYNNHTGLEIDRGSLFSIVSVVDVPDLILAEIERFDSLSDMIVRSGIIPKDHEGWVVRFDSGHRIKIKGDAYCRVHAAISHCTPISAWNSFVHMERGSDLISILPEEFILDYLRMTGIIRGMYDYKLAIAKSWIDKFSDYDNKSIGLNDAIPREFKNLIFMSRKCDLDSELMTNIDFRKKFCMSFRPSNNFLPGYTPSSAMNRFSSQLQEI